ncbi:MAG: GNAT family N-acetyltransferase, partial [Actinobacteria bacterium]|nr:GNAT family N-acetyltransferase [Actinomycetota bacterium]
MRRARRQGHGRRDACAPRLQRGARDVDRVSREVALVEYELEHREAYVRLLREAWGDAALSEEEFDWWFDGNPCSSLRAVALVDGEVAGAMGFSLVPMVVDGRSVLGQLAVHAVTGEKARGLGIFRGLCSRMVEQGRERGAVAALVFPNAMSSPVFAGPLGWRVIDRRRVWARPLRGLGARLGGRPPAPLAPPLADGDGVRVLDRLGPEQER